MVMQVSLEIILKNVLTTAPILKQRNARKRTFYIKYLPRQTAQGLLKAMHRPEAETGG